MTDTSEIGFAYNGIWITDPTLDETGRFTVDPSEYYGSRYENAEIDWLLANSTT